MRRLAVSSRGDRVVTASDDKTALVWDVRTHRVLHTLRVPVGAGDVGRLYGVAISPDGESVALAGTTQRIHLFDLASGSFRRAFDARGDGIRRLVWSADGAHLATVSLTKPALRVFRVADGELLHEAALPADSYGLSITAGGRLAVASFDARLRLFQLFAAGASTGVRADGEIAVDLPDPVSVSFSPDGRLLATGYFSRAAAGRVLVDVFDAGSQRRLQRFEFSNFAFGNLMNVAWQADGQALYAGGTGYGEPGRFVVQRIGWPDGRIESAVAASDSIQDFAALPDGRMAIASFDATWTLLDGVRVAARSESPIGRVSGASALRVAADARGCVLQWADGTSRGFDLVGRSIRPSESVQTHPAEPSTLRLRVSDWENSRSPRINGQAVDLLPLETSRASAVLPDAGSVILGTSRALHRLDRGGRALWSVPLNTEVRAVNLSTDGRLVVTALADGTLRWWRSDDGAALLSLLLLRDGRWVVWTESGYFDAGPGAEDLVGWLVSRPGEQRADYFGASRFRERFLRPDVIDQVLAQQDVARAVVVANEQRVRQAALQADAQVIKTVEAAVAPPSAVQARPPVITLAQAARADITGTEVTVAFKVFGDAAPSGERVSARVDGRPVPARVEWGAGVPDGESEGRVVVALPKPEGTLQLFAQGPHGTSMPAEVNFRSSAPALRPVDRRPTLYLLSIGVSRYASTPLNLALAAKDAQDFARSMEAQSGQLYQRVEARVLVDERATRAAVLQGLAWLQGAASPNDMAMLFLAGHGVSDAADVYHFLPHDTQLAQLRSTTVSETHLRGALAAIRGRALFFVDTCFAGKSVGSFSRRETNRLSNGLASAEMGVIVFSASAPRQESLEHKDWGNGAFTKALVDGLSGRADFRREGLVTHKGLDYYVADAVRSLTSGRQTPVTAVPTGISDFPLAATSAVHPNNSKE